MFLPSFRRSLLQAKHAWVPLPGNLKALQFERRSEWRTRMASVANPAASSARDPGSGANKRQVGPYTSGSSPPSKIRGFASSSRACHRSAGTAHHLALNVPTDEDLATQKAIYDELGYTDCSEIKDRNYFHSIYCRCPGGILVECAATAPGGFARDEPFNQLGKSLLLPPWFEARRPEIEKMSTRSMPSRRNGSNAAGVRRGTSLPWAASTCGQPGETGEMTCAFAHQSISAAAQLASVDREGGFQLPGLRQGLSRSVLGC